ncbi:hypothetical protein [Kocuria nitroreducens]|uniref:hypothetical protein n=1 Tax=Kocuria nitroreducens TaxID=3058914 RepID=UPI0036DC4B05
MTVDLLPSRSPQTSSRPDDVSDRGSAPQTLGGGRHRRSDVEPACPYCAGPETD